MNVHECLQRVYGELTKDQSVLDRLLKAKPVYVELTGMLDDLQDEYETRMQSFNDWFVFDYIPNDGQSPYINEFLKKHDVDETVKKSLSNTTYSVYEYSKKSFSKNTLLKDLLHQKKLEFRPDNFTFSLPVGEIFTGRIYSDENGEMKVLDGLRFIPKEAKSAIVKKAKKVKQLGSPSEERNFVFHLEKLKTKWLQFNHRPIEEIFKFD